MLGLRNSGLEEVVNALGCSYANIMQTEPLIRLNVSVEDLACVRFCHVFWGSRSQQDKLLVLVEFIVGRRDP